MKSKIKFTTRFIYCCGQLEVLCRNFFNATNSKDRPTVDAKNSAKCGANLLVEHSTPITKVTMPSLWDFADPQGEFNKFHSLLGSVSVNVQDKTFTVLLLPSLLFLESAKNLADTWPAARVLSRSRERTLHGNEVGWFPGLEWHNRDFKIHYGEVLLRRLWPSGTRLTTANFAPNSND